MNLRPRLKKIYYDEGNDSINVVDLNPFKLLKRKLSLCKISTDKDKRKFNFMKKHTHLMFRVENYQDTLKPIEGTLNGHKCEFILDTGATIRFHTLNEK